MTRCGLAERVKGWPPGCGFAGFARLPQVFSWLGMREDAWGRRAARGRCPLAVGHSPHIRKGAKPVW